MIINLLIFVIISIVGAVFNFLPVVTIASIPYIGTDLSSILTTMILTWNAFMATFPYAVVVWHVFLIVVLPFELLLLLGKFFLGHRFPAHLN